MIDRDEVLAAVRIDPVEDAGDAHLWGALFRAAWPFGPLDPTGVYGVLRGLRSLGCRLTIGRDGDVRRLWLWPWEGASTAELVEAMGDHAPTVQRLLRDAVDRGRDDEVGQLSMMRVGREVVR